MQLPHTAATMWQTSSRALLDLVSVRGFKLASKFAPFSQVKYLHDSAKQPDAVVKSEHLPTVDKTKSTLDTKIAVEEPGLAKDKDKPATPRYSKGKYPNQIAALGKRIEVQRALGFPNLQGHPAQKKYIEDQRAAGFPILEKASEVLRASGYRGFREGKRAALLRDIEAANKRKLAEDPTYKPPPLPDFDINSGPKAKTSRAGYMKCPRPGCPSRCKDETTMKIHLRRMHNEGYSEETPYKCEFASCNRCGTQDDV
jgi:hypothetical protein